MAQARDYDMPPKTPPPAYDGEGRRGSRVAWAGEWPLVDGPWTTASAAEKCGDKATTGEGQGQGKDPKTLGPSVEVVTVPVPRDLLYNTKESDIEVKSAKRCRCALITLVVIMSFVIVGLVIGMAVGFHQLKKANNKHDNGDSLCAGRTCSNNGECQEFELMRSLRYSWCTCKTGFTGTDCEISSKPCEACVYGTCLAVTYAPEGEIPPMGELDDQPDSSAQYGPNGMRGKTTTPCAKGPKQPTTTPSKLSQEYQCVCYAGYQGENCDIPTSSNDDPCAGVTCNHHGACAPLFIPMPMPYPDSPNGNSPPPPTPRTTTSSWDSSSYMCTCKPGYTGKDCEIAFANA